MGWEESVWFCGAWCVDMMGILYVYIYIVGSMMRYLLLYIHILSESKRVSEVVRSLDCTPQIVFNIHSPDRRNDFRLWETLFPLSAIIEPLLEMISYF